MNYIGNEPVPGGVILVGDTNPIGSILWGHKVPDGSYLALTGQIVSKVTFADLWTYAQGFLTADQVANPGLYKSIDANTFALPKLDGLFIRSTGQVDASHVAAALGVKQADDNLAHTHAPVGGAQFIVNQPTSLAGLIGGAQLHTVNLANSGGTEARPVNVALVPCVKALKTILMPSSVLPTIPPLDFVLLDTKDAAGSATLDFTAGFSSGYSVFQFELINVLPSTLNTALLARFSTDGGATFSAGASDYQETLVQGIASAASVLTRSVSALQVSPQASNSAEGGASGTAKVFQSTAGTRRVQLTSQTVANHSVSGIVNYSDAGWYAINGPINAVRFLPAAGTITSGRIKMYGIR